MYADAQVQASGVGTNIAEALDPIARFSEPYINATDMLTRPFMTPASVVGNVIAGDPIEAIKQGVSATYWGTPKMPSEALMDHGILPDTPGGRLIGLGADVAPAFAIPSLKTVPGARARTAARDVSRRQDIGRVTDAAGQNTRTAQQAAARVDPIVRAKAGKKQTQAVRLRPGAGPDVRVNPSAPSVKMRPTRGGATRGTKPRPANTRPPVPVSRMPYPPTRRVAAAASEATRARTAHTEATRARPTIVQASRAGERLGAARAGLRTAEAATVARIRSTPHTKTSKQAAQIGARFPVTKAGAARPTSRTSTPRSRTPGVRAPGLARPRQPKLVKPKDVPYTKIPKAQSRVTEARATVRELLSAPAAAKPQTVARAQRTVELARQELNRPPAAGQRRPTKREYQAHSRMVRAMERIVELQARTEGAPSRPALIKAGQELIRATVAHRNEVGSVRAAQTAARARAARTGKPPAGKPTAAQARAARPHKSASRSVFDDRPRTIRDLRASPRQPIEGGKTLALARTRVNDATRRVEATTTKRPTAKQVAAAGARVTRAEAELKRATAEMWGKAADRREAHRVGKVEATVGQQSKHRETFTGSRERDWIDANMGYQAAFDAARLDAPLGVNVAAPWNRRGKGVDIPIASLAKTKEFRAWVGNNATAPVIKQAAAVLNWYRRAIVSRYGPNQTVRWGAIAADDITRAGVTRAHKFIAQEAARARLTAKQMEIATRYLERTTKKGDVVTPAIRAFADKMNKFTEDQASLFIQAGGPLRRLRARDGEKTHLDGGIDRQYVFHVLPADEHVRYMASALANRTLVYGRTPGFTKKRNVVTIEDLKMAGFHPVERLDQLTLARASAHARAMAEMELARSVEKRFGRRGQDVPDTWEIVPSPYRLHDTFVPPDVAQTLRSVIETRMRFPKSKTGMLLVKGNSLWKEWALFTLGYDIRNQFGDTVLGFQATVNPMAPVMSVVHGVRTAVRRDGNVGGKSDLTTRQGRDVAEAGGLRQSGFVSGELLHDPVRTARGRGEQTTLAITEKGWKAVGQLAAAFGRHPIRTGRRGLFSARSGRESGNRSGIAMREMRKGEGPVHAVRESKATLFDYGDVGTAVEALRRYPIGAPFVTWTAKNLPRQIRLALQEPAQLAAILTALDYLQENMNLGIPEEYDLPGYVSDRQPANLPGVGNVVFDIPTNSLNRIPIFNGREGAVALQWFNELAPGPKAAIALAFNINPLTGEQFRGTRPANFFEQVISGEDATYKDEAGVEHRVPGVDDRSAWFLHNLVPFLRTAGSVSGTTPGRSWMDTASSAVFGIGVTPPLTPERAGRRMRSLAYELQRERIPKFKRRIEAQGLTGISLDPNNPSPESKLPPSMRREFRSLIRDIVEVQWFREFVDSGGKPPKRGRG